MNRFLLIWNIVLSILLMLVFVGGCASMDPEFTRLANQVEANRLAIESLAAAVSQNTNTITAQAQQLANINTSIGNTIAQVSTTLQKYVQDYVAAYFQAYGQSK